MSKRLVNSPMIAVRARPGSHGGAEPPRRNRYHAFLKRLHAGGRSNMYGAIPYLVEAFAIDRTEAFRIVCDWVDGRSAQQPQPRDAASTRD
jgi:hypothetical protein